jgi:hypothetical protein
MKQYVICRCHDAGVHAGYVVQDEGQWVILENARRVWSWEGAASLSQLAVSGAGPGSKIGCTLKRMKIRATDVCEILDCEPEAVKWFQEIEPWKV